MLAPLVVLGVGLVAYLLCYTFYRAHPPVDSDGQGYYAYLPSYLLHRDTTFKVVLFQHILPQYAGLGHPPPLAFGFTLQPSGAYLDKYGVGEAILLVPFFLLGHALAIVLGANAEGYSGPEVYVVGLGALVYTIAGLFALRAVLRRWFSDRVVAATLLAVTLGTGAVIYFSWEPLFSHDFTFFAVAVLLLAAVRWFERPASWSRAAVLGLAIGAVIAIRLTNVVLIVAVPLYGVGSLAALRLRWRLLLGNVARIAVAGACALVVLVPQVVTWYFATGHLIARPYEGERFDWAHPQLLQSLFWLRPHGLVPYYPILGLALVGLGVAWFRRRDLALPVTLAFLPFWFLTSAWWDWSFSDAFGDRAYVDIAPLLALPLAALFASLRLRAMRLATGAAAVVLVAITCTLTVTYLQRRLPEDGIDARGYVQLLVHPQRLLSPPPR